MEFLIGEPEELTAAEYAKLTERGLLGWAGILTAGSRETLTLEATVHGVRLAYDDRGDGPPVVFVHAFPLNRAMWRRRAEAVRGGWRAIAVDPRGFGGSAQGSAGPTQQVPVFGRNSPSINELRKVPGLLSNWSQTGRHEGGRHPLERVTAAVTCGG